MACSTAEVSHLFSDSAGCIFLKFRFHTKICYHSYLNSLSLLVLQCTVCDERSLLSFSLAVFSPSLFSFSLSSFPLCTVKKQWAG